MINEIWKEIPGWPKYQASNLGRIKRIAGYDASGKRWLSENILKTKTHGDIVLSDSPHRPLWYTSVARLVLLSFKGPAPSSEEDNARHLDDNRMNNALENLAWGTDLENMQDKVRNGRTTKGTPRPLDVRLKIGQSQIGKTISDEHIQSMRQKKLGKDLSEQHRKNISSGMKGKRRRHVVLSDEDVIEIRRLAKDGVSRGIIRRQYNVSHTHVTRIVSGLSRKDKR